MGRIGRIALMGLVLAGLAAGRAGAVVTTAADAVVYDGNGSNKAFVFGFGVWLSAQVRVCVIDANGVPSVQTENSDYTVTLPNGDGWLTPGGTVTFTAAPATGTHVYIARCLALEQAANYADADTLDLATVQADFDAAAARDLQLRRELRRAPRAPEGDWTDMNVPAVADRQSRYFYWDSNGKPAAGTPVAGALTLLSSWQNLLEAAVPLFVVTAHPYHAVADYNGSSGTDATAAIQAALDAAKAAGGGTVLIPPGEYWLADSSLPNYTGPLHIDGNDITVLGYGATLHTPQDFHTSGLIMVKGTAGAYIHNIAILGLAVNMHQAAIDVVEYCQCLITGYCNNVLLRDLKLYNPGFTGIGISYGGQGIRVQDCLVDHCWGDGIHIGDQVSPATISDVWVTGCLVKAAADSAYACTGGSGRLFFLDCVADSPASACVDLSGCHDVTVRNVHGWGYQQHGIRMLSAGTWNVDISDCQIGAPVTPGYYCIHTGSGNLGVASSWMRIHGNMCNVGAGVGSGGIFVQGIHDALITGNIITGTVGSAQLGLDLQGVLAAPDANNVYRNNTFRAVDTAIRAGNAAYETPYIAADNAFVHCAVNVSGLTYPSVTDTGVRVGNGATSAGYVDLCEDSDNGTNYLRHQAPAALAGNVTLTWPGDDGDPNEVLKTNGSGTLDWAPAGSEDVNNITADITNFDTHGLQIISSNTAPITGALADGTTVGQRVKFVCKTAGNNIDITVSHHVTSDPEVIRLDTAKEWVELVWDGTDWVECGGSGQSYP